MSPEILAAYHERMGQIQARRNVLAATIARFASPPQTEEEADTRAAILHEWSRAAVGLPPEGEIGPEGFSREPGVTYVRTGEQFRRALAQVAESPGDNLTTSANRAVLGLPTE